jgi:SAM-dependent methyltransferase
MSIVVGADGVTREAILKIDYDHAMNGHTSQGALAALTALLGDCCPHSLLDVGCGTGTWLRAALDVGVADVVGMDGVVVPTERLHVPADVIQRVDLLGDWPIKRQFDLVLCLEVAEHLPEEAASALVRKLTTCGDRVFFSAANPWQQGQHHVNLQWPSFWQNLFNQEGFVCYDHLRWKIWDDASVERWYRQNLFVAEKDVAAAGNEPRLLGVIHPDCMPAYCEYYRQSRLSLPEALAGWLNRHVRRLLGGKRYV